MRPGAWSWIGLGAFVIAADTILSVADAYFKLEQSQYATMSVVFNDVIADGAGKWPATLFWSLLTLHLFKPYLPKEIHKFDPFTGIAEMLSELIIIPLTERLQ
jgi:hypothetical protein